MHENTAIDGEYHYPVPTTTERFAKISQVTLVVAGRGPDRTTGVDWVRRAMVLAFVGGFGRNFKHL